MLVCTECMLNALCVFGLFIWLCRWWTWSFTRLFDFWLGHVGLLLVGATIFYMSDIVFHCFLWNHTIHSDSLSSASQGNLLIADYGNKRIQRCSTASPGAACMTVIGRGSAGSGSIELNRPIGVTMAADGTLWNAKLSLPARNWLCWRDAEWLGCL